MKNGYLFCSANELSASNFMHVHLRIMILIILMHNTFLAYKFVHLNANLENATGLFHG